MSTEPQQKLDRTPSKYETPSGLFPPVAKFQKFRKFWRTRDAVLTDVPIHDYSARELSSVGLMGPWEFNATQSALAGTPGTIISTWHSFFAADSASVALEVKLFTAIIPLLIPFLLMLTAYCIGWASLWKKHSTKASRALAARAFLYLDGAYGFLPQFFISFWKSVPALDELSLPVPLPLVFAIWQLYVLLKTIPENLFEVLGYSSGSQDPYIKLLDAPTRNEMPPKWKYRLSVLIIGPAVCFTVAIAVYLLCDLTAHVLKSF